MHPDPTFDDRLQGEAGFGLEIIETLRAEGGCVPRQDRHLARMAATAARLGYVFDAAEARAALAGLPPGVWRARLALSRDGLRLEHAPMPAPLAEMRLALSPVRLRAEDPWLRVKTTHRAVYDAARANLPAGVDEVIFLNQRGEVCEGAITTVFARINGRLLTPAQSCGLLPGVLRAQLLDSGQAHEAVLWPADLHAAQALFVGNALRGLVPARLPHG